MKRHLPVFIDQTLTRVRVAQQDFSESFSEDMGDYTCKKGCSHCCSHPLLISFAEGAILYRSLRDNGAWGSGMVESLKTHSEVTLGLHPEVWLASEMPCPLLKASLCSAYSARPLQCRTKFSRGDPDMCRATTAFEAPLANNVDLVRNFNDLEHSLFRAIKGKHWLMPLSTALLIGERISEGNLKPEEAYAALTAMYIKEN